MNNKESSLLNDNLPFKQSMSKSRQFGYGNRWHGEHRYNQIKILLRGYENRSFKEFFNAIKPYLKYEAKPMSEILTYFKKDNWRGYTIINGIIRCEKNKNTKHLHNVLCLNNIYYFITEESKIGRKLCFKGKSWWGDKEKSTRIGFVGDYSSCDDKTMEYKKFILHFVRGSKQIYNASITQFEADYFLNPEAYSYQEYGKYIINIDKCLKFQSKAALLKYLKRKHYELLAKNSKTERETAKAKLDEANELIGRAMADFNERQQKIKLEKAERHQKELAERAKDKEILLRHGFDETSFRTPQKKKKGLVPIYSITI